MRHFLSVACGLGLLAAAPTLTYAQTPAAGTETAPAAPAAPAAAPALTPPNAAFAAKAASYTGAPASKGRYRAVYQLDSNDPKLIGQTLRNMKNALADPRLKGKLELELVAFSGGTVVFKKNQPYEADVLALQQAGVVLAQCQNSMHAYQLTPADMLPYISYVPTGNGELIIRQADGWSLVHP